MRQKRLALSNCYPSKIWETLFFLKMGQSRPLFVYFRSFLITILIQIEKSVDGVLGIQTQGHRMVGAEETTELWRSPMRFGKL